MCQRKYQVEAVVSRILFIVGYIHRILVEVMLFVVIIESYKYYFFPGLSLIVLII
jgi:hypothetical protein